MLPKQFQKLDIKTKEPDEKECVSYVYSECNEMRRMPLAEIYYLIDIYG